MTLRSKIMDCRSRYTGARGRGGAGAWVRPGAGAPHLGGAEALGRGAALL